MMPTSVKSPSASWKTHYDSQANRLGDTPEANDYRDAGSYVACQQWFRLIGKVRKQAVLEIGCGSGLFVRPLLENNIVYGIDISPEMAKLAVQKGLRVALGSAGSLPFDSQTFDLVLCHGVIGLLEQPQTLFAEARRVLRPGGTFFVACLNAQSWIRRGVQLMKRPAAANGMRPRQYRFEEILALGNQAGLAAKESLGVYYPLRIPASSCRLPLSRLVVPSFALLFQK
ncbi:MAG: class I SAM-dependent methyltransferase [Candidatus Omnitrophica bacterium]|nr:class I SAM-dependent methyltransferase [Candidatus Omnitrophota bacterium]